jgi:general secretion pathway protein D
VEGSGNFLGNEPSQSPLALSSQEDDITLNLVDVPIRQAAKTILGDILSVNYTVDSSISGNVTIQTSAPVAASAAIELFEAALKSNNAALSLKGSVYQIISSDRALANSTISIGKRTPSEQAVGATLRIVQLDYISAREMKRILEPMAHSGGIVDVDPARNTITLSGNPQDIASLLETISVFDVDVMKGMSFAMIPVETSAPSIIADELREVFATGQEGPMAGMVRFLPNQRLGTILVISPQREYLSRAEAWIKRLDAQASGSERQFYTYKVQNRQAQELVEVITSMLNPGARSTRRNVTPQSRESIGSTFGQNGFQTGQGLSATDYDDAVATDPGNSTPAAVQLQLNEDDKATFNVVADPTKNTILTEATPKDYRRILRLIKTLDVMPNQVLIEATIAEVSLTDELRFGIRWYFKEQASTFKFSDHAAGSLASVFPGFSYALAMSNVEATLNALSGVTNINIVSSPSLTVMDNKTALLQIGDQVPIITQSAASVENPDATIVNSVSYRDTGVILSITPQINESGRVHLEIEQEVSSVSTTQTSGIDSPTIRQRKVKTSVVVNDGEAIALGGLIQKSQTTGRTQIPIIGDIPVLGSVFKEKNDDLEKTELLILLKPYVMRNLIEARQITEEFKDEFASRVLDQREETRSLERGINRIID